MGFTTRIVAIVNDMLNEQKTNYRPVLQLAGPVLIAETLSPLLERIAVALENKNELRPSIDEAKSPPTVDMPREWAERLAEEKARTERALQAGNECFEKYKEALDTITQLQERLRMVGLPV